MPKFTTLVPHIGDRPYEPYQIGETREVDDENSVKHLVDGGTLGDYDADAEKAFLKSKEPPAAKGGVKTPTPAA